MDIKQMVYFKTIVEAGTISKAAEILHMAQPPLSMQLKQLEDELGIQLLIRGHRNIELTPAGRLFYKRSLQMISLSETTLHEMKNTHTETLHIGITSSNSPLLYKIHDYLSSNPQLAFRIHEGTTYEMIDLLNAHIIDIAVVRTPFDQSQVQAYYLKDEPMVMVGGKEFLDHSMTQMKDYQGSPLIIHQRYLSLISDYCLNLQFNPFIKVTCDDCRTSFVWASLHQGVTIIPKSALTLNHDDNLITVELSDTELYTSSVLITRKQEKLNKRLAEFIQHFITKFDIM